jgi:hypothetical protein
MPVIHVSKEARDNVVGAAGIVWMHLQEFAREHGSALLLGQPLPAEAATELAKIIAWSQGLKEDAAKLEPVVLTPPNRDN